MPPQVVIVANQTLPVATLPDTAFTTNDAALAPPLLHGQSAREPRLDLRPAIGVVGIPGRQTPEAMQVVGQHHDGQHLERPRRMRRAERRPQVVHVFHQQTATTLQKIDREKVGATRHTDATIVRHAPASRRWWRIAIGMRRAWVSENPSTPLHRARRPLRHRRAQGPPYENNFQGGVGRAQARLTPYLRFLSFC